MRPAHPPAPVALLLTLLASQPSAQEVSETLPYPKYQFMRQGEDWSVLAGHDLSATGDWTDRLKYIELNDDGSIWLSIGGHARTRYEYWNDFNFGRPPMVSHDDGFLLGRVLLHADLHFYERARLFVELKTALSTDRDLPGGKRTMDVDQFDLQQGFLDLDVPLGETSATVRGGRQEFQFGKQRLVSPLPWGNTLRTWDGVSAWTDIAGWSVTGFWSQFVPVKKYEFNEPDHGQDFWGLYSTRKFGSDTTVDAYFLTLDNDDSTFNGTSGQEDRYTVGARVGGKVPGTGFDYDVEAAYQFGEVGSGDVSAYMLAAVGGYTWKDVGLTPRLFAGLDLASGDDSPGGDVETFNQLYPLGHAYFGYMDYIGRQNIFATHGGLSLKPTEKLTATASYHVFFLDDEDDALYTPSGSVSVPGGSSDDFVGSEIDLTLQYSVNRHLSALVGYSHFFSGDVIEDSAAMTDDSDFAYVSLQYTF